MFSAFQMARPNQVQPSCSLGAELRARGRHEPAVERPCAPAKQIEDGREVRRSFSGHSLWRDGLGQGRILQFYCQPLIPLPERHP